MPKVRVSEATNLQLDWMVATAEGGLYQGPSASSSFWIWPGATIRYSKSTPNYCTDYSHGCPIIDREEINLNIHDGWWATMIRPGGCFRQHGPERLVAAMRAYVTSRFGDEVEVPEELCESK